MTNFMLCLEYDGTAYHGWQKQKNEATIQGELEKALLTMTRQKITVHGSGRTDAGVHAWRQVANFHGHTRLLPENFIRGLNSLLAHDIVITDCRIVPADFHARFSAKSKTYRYHLLNRPIPAAIFRQYAWHIKSPLDISAMRRALPAIIGAHDFSAFEGAGSPRTSAIRDVRQASLETQKDGSLYLEITADGFLRYMVRNLVGSLVAIGAGQHPPEWLQTLLAGRDRRLASPTAPPHGLFLVKVEY